MRKLFFTYYLLMLSAFAINAQNTIESPTINNVSVISEEGHVEISWSYDEPDSIDGFIIYYLDPSKDPPPSFSFATVPDSMATSYIDESGIANDSSIAYEVAAYKKMNDTIETSPLTGQPHFTIYLEVDWEGCSDSIYLNWNEYVGWEDDIISYRIHENGSFLASTFNTSYPLGATINSNYQYVIEAVNTKNNNLRSNSNIVSLQTTFPEPTEFINADFATVEDESIELSFTLGNSGSDYDYILVSKPPSSSTFSDTLDDGIDYNQKIEFDYLIADIGQQYQFKLLEQDRCGRVVKESNISSNIVLSGVRNENIINLNWTEYLDWLGNIESYILYRDVGNGFEEIRESTALSFQDDISNLANNKRTKSVRYYIEANEDNTNPHGIKGQSKSNILVIYLESLIKFPTAFTPNNDGTNDIFRPIDLQFIPADYHLIIFDRWGKKVFETKQAEEGWDGKFNSGKNVTEGVYHYHTTYKDADGNETSQTGIVTVIYP